MKLLILGATGFIGQQVVKEAISRNWNVTAVVRNLDSERARSLAKGVLTIAGDAERPDPWQQALSKVDIVIDLVQPELPRRIGAAQMREIADRRARGTRALLAALMAIPEPHRPLLFSVSGFDDLQPDATGKVTEHSRLCTELKGFANVGVPIRKLIEDSRIDAAHLYLGTVYGPGKAFASTVFPRLATGKFRVPGDGRNRMPLVHVEDAGRAIIHIAALPRNELVGRSIAIADGHVTEFSAFLSEAARLMSAPAPSSVPKWLARLAVGPVLFEALTRDILVKPETLFRTGFDFRFPSYLVGLPPTLQSLGYMRRANAGAVSIAKPRISRSFVALAILAIGLLLSENKLDFPMSVPYFLHLSGGLPLLDMRLHYDVHEVAQLFESLGPTGLRSYLRFYGSVDILLPAVFGTFLRAAIGRTGFRRLRWLALAAAFSDYAENIAVVVLLLNYPRISSTQVALASGFTTLKSILYLGSVGIAVAGAVAPFASKKIPLKAT